MFLIERHAENRPSTSPKHAREEDVISRELERLVYSSDSGNGKVAQSCEGMTKC